MPSNETAAIECRSRSRLAGDWLYGPFKTFLVAGIAAVSMAITASATVGIANASAGNAAGDGNREASERATEPDWQRFDKALALAKDTGKLIIVNFYTDWCPNCRRMNEKTYRDEAVLKQLSKSFIPVKLNAESAQPLIIEGQTLTEYQVALVFRVSSYPTTWFLTSEGRPLLPVRGYYGPDLFAPMLRFVEGRWYEKMDFDMYMEREKRSEK